MIRDEPLLLRHRGPASDAGLRHAQALAKLAHVITCPDGSFESWSDTLPMLVGVEPGDMPQTTRAWLDIVHPDDRALVRGNAIAASYGELPAPFEYRVRRADGRWIHLRHIMEPLDSSDAGISRVRCFNTVQDVTAEREIEHSLRGSESLKGAILESSLESIITIDHTGKIVEFNPAAVAMFGRTRSEALGTSMAESIVPLRFRERHARGMASYLASGTSRILGKRIEIAALRRDGSEFPVEMAITAHGTPSAPMFTAFVRDITARNETDRRVARLNRVYAVLSGINTLIVRVRDREELFNESCRVAIEAGGFCMAWIGLLNPRANVVELVAAAGDVTDYFDAAPAALLEVTPGGRGLVSQAILGRQPLVFNDLSTEPQLSMATQLAKRNINSLAIIPLVIGDDALGVLGLYSRDAGAFDLDEMRLLRELAGDIAFAHEHIDKARKLHRLTRVNAILSGVNAAIVRISDRNELFEEACRIAVETGGMPLAWVGVVDDAATQLRVVASAGTDNGFLDTIHDRNSLLDDAPDGHGIASVAIRESRAMVVNDAATDPRVKHKQAHADRGISSVAALPLFIGGKASGVLILYAEQAGFFDDDELKLLNEVVGNIAFALEHIEKEEKVRRLTRVHAMLSGVNSLIVRVRDRDELFRDACRIAVEHGGFLMAWIGEVDRIEMKIKSTASTGATPEFLRVLREQFSLHEEVAFGNSLAATAIRENKPVFSNDAQNDPNVMLKAEHVKRGSHSVAVLPLHLSEESVGVLALYSTESGFFDDEEMKLLTELAGNISFALDNIEKAKKLDYLAFYDVLTGLANRTLFVGRLAQYARSAIGGEHKLALYLIDLERFKNINDTFGQAAGDALLRQVAELLTQNVGDAGLVARVGADRFAVVMPEVNREQDVARLLEKTMEVFLNHSFDMNDGKFRVSAKAGIALFPDDGVDADVLLRNAEAALKKAKASGDRYLFYTQKMTEMVAGRLTLEHQLREALEKNEFVLHYQPKIGVADGKLIGAEALIRWNDPRTGLVPPGSFIPVLEETGLIHDVGRWALHQAIADYLRWRNAGLAAVRIAVNVSPLQMRNRGFIDEISEVISADPGAAAGLELEITEGMIMGDVSDSVATLRAIRAMGVSIAIDDFGTGFSSLGYLSKLPVDTLKIDRSFIIDMTAGPDGLSLVSTIINLAHSLRLKAVAEGVETEEQSRLLRLLTCDEMQGFLFSKPLPADVFESRFLTGEHRQLSHSPAALRR